MKLPTGAVGVLAAMISFFAIGIPLYERGVSFPLCFLAQLGLMGLIIGTWIFLMERRDYREINGKLQVRHGRLGHWEDIQKHLKDEHGIE